MDCSSLDCIQAQCLPKALCGPWFGPWFGLLPFCVFFFEFYNTPAHPSMHSPFYKDNKCQGLMGFLKKCITSTRFLISLTISSFTLMFVTSAWEKPWSRKMRRVEMLWHIQIIPYIKLKRHTQGIPRHKCLAVIWALEHFRPYIKGLHETIFTWHSNFRWLMSCPNLAGWSLWLQDFNHHSAQAWQAQQSTMPALLLTLHQSTFDLMLHFILTLWTRPWDTWTPWLGEATHSQHIASKNIINVTLIDVSRSTWTQSK